MPEHIAIITVVYKNYTVLEDFFASLAQQTNHEFHVFAADASPDKKPIAYKDLKITTLAIENKGYAYGINQAIDAARSKGFTRFAIMNNDTYLDRSFMKTLGKTMETYPTTLIGAKIYYASGFEYHKDRYDKKDLGKVFWYAGGIVDWAHALTHHRGVDMVDTGQYDKAGTTEFITGCFVAYDETVFQKLGAWDESYFLYYEDADFSERAKQNNLKLLYEPTLVMYHKNAQSTGGAGSNIHQKFQEKGRLRYALKYAPLRTKMHILKLALQGKL
ncbi:MAG: glycosyltransferase family 2 protein [Weeksellaceae bacterium]